MFRMVLSGFLLVLIVTGASALTLETQPVGAIGATIYIGADGSVSPFDAPILTVDNVTYTFTGDVRYPVYLGIVVGRNDSVIDGNGHVVLGDSMFDNNYGVSLENLSNVTIKNINVQSFHWGIGLFLCTNCTVSGNNATGNLVGIGVSTSSYSVFVGNNVVANGFVGMQVGDYSNNNVIIGNNAERNGFQGMAGNPVGGIFVDVYSDGNTVVQNNITGNFDGMYLGGASNTNIYHNNFLNNVVQVYSGMYGSGSATVWDDGYPSGGNYWSDYNGTDLYGGPYQNITGSDGIGDTPYVIDANNTDNYPLIISGRSVTYVHDVAVTNVTIPFSNAYQGWVLNITVTVTNLGNATENFTTALDYDNNTIGTQVIANLAPNATMTLLFSWNTTNVPYSYVHNYTITAIASTVPGESDTGNNQLSGGQVQIRKMGDVNGDGVVNMKDVAAAILAFNTWSGKSRWNPDCDLDLNGIVNMRDIVTIVKNFNPS